MTLKRTRHGRENERPGSAPQPRPGLHLEGPRSHGRKSRRGPAGYDPSSLRFRAGCAARGTSATRSCGRIINRVHRTGERRPRRMALGAPGRRPPNPRARLHRPRRSRRPRARRARPMHRRLPLQRKPSRRLGTPAVQKAALQPELFAILGATPYSLRRGGISLRLRSEDPQTVASECGPAYARSAPTTPTRSRTSAAADPGQPTPSGAPHAQNKPNAKR